MNTSLQNIESTILENWLGPQEKGLPDKNAYHFAIRQDGVSLDFYLKKYFSNIEVVFHFFENSEQLLTVCLRNPIDAIIIGGKGNFLPELEMVRAIKQKALLSFIPVILHHPDPDNAIVVAAFENGAEEFIHDGWVDAVVRVRILKVIERNRRDLAINPSTCLPGTALIEAEIVRQIQMKEQFALCYADLDNFKAYNDYYGYAFGDKVVKLTARLIRDVVLDLCREGFVGHIAGDDFIFIIPSEIIDKVCSTILTSFDRLISCRYEPEDRDRGYIETANRKGVMEKFPLLTLSIAVIVNENGKFEHPGEISKMLADLKKATKAKEGSNYMVERRSKY